MKTKREVGVLFYKSYRKFFEHGSSAINLLETLLKCLSNEKLP